MLINRSVHLLRAPNFEDEDKTRTAKLLNVILITMLTLAIVYLFMAPIIEPNPLAGLIGNGITVVVYLSVFILMRRGQVQLASLLFSSSLWLMVSLLAIAYGGVTTPALFSYFSCIVVAGLLLGDWPTFAFAGLSIASGFGVFLAEFNGILPPPLLTTTSFAMWWIATVNFLMVAVLLFLANRNIRKALEQARHEIAKRRLMEEQLRESEEQYRQLMQELPVGVEVFKPDGTLVAVNKSWENIWNVQAEAVVGRYNPLKNEAFREMGLMSFIEQAFAGEQVLIPNIEFDPGKSDLPGRKRWMEGLAYNVKDQQGRIKNVVLLSEDITERKEAEAALGRSEKYFRSLTENALDIITVLDSDGSIRYESPSIEWALGYKPEELIGQNVFDFIHPEDLPSVMTTFAERSQIAGPAPPVEARFRHKDGSWRVIEAVGTNLLEDSAVAGIVVNSRDITERKQLQEQLLQAQKMDAIGQLTAGIAHDFNNLLTAINGFAELMRRELAAGDSNQDYLDKILNSGGRAADLVRQLLAFSSKQVIKPRVLDLNSSVASMDKMLRRIIGEDIALETRLTPELGAVKVDPTQLEQVIVNLAVNARDAMLGGGRLTIETANITLDADFVAHHLETEPGEYTLLSVSDTGVGMSEAVKAHIFEPFFTTKAQGKGTGLGLATVFGIVKQNHGHIWVYSEPGTGTTFKIYLPSAEEEQPYSTPMMKEAELPAGTETILLVEDDADVRNLVRQVLQAQGYTLLEAEDGQAALRLVAGRATPIHLLLTDVIMPGMSGKVLAEQLSQDQMDLKTLFMSGYTDDTIAHHGILEAGISYLQKPFSPTALARKVRSTLDN